MSNRNRKRERWSQAGLLKREQTHPGYQRSVTMYGDDTAEREGIIQDYLDHGHTLQQAADELILRGYELYKGGSVRQFLLKYVDAQQVLLDPESLYVRRRGMMVSLTNPKEAEQAQRKRIRRMVTAVGNASELTPETRDVMALAFYGLAGVSPAALHGETELPRFNQPRDAYPPADLWPTIAYALADHESVTDAHLLQGLGAAREVAGHIVPLLGAAIHVATGMPPIEWARQILSGHGCIYQHTLTQAFTPLLTLMALFDPEELKRFATFSAHDVQRVLKQVTVTVPSGGYWSDASSTIFDALREIHRKNIVDADNNPATM